MMTFIDFNFYVFATMLIVAALGVITARNPVHSALFLVLSFFSCSALWLLLEAEFLAIVLVLVYVGAVMVLFLLSIHRHTDAVVAQKTKKLLAMISAEFGESKETRRVKKAF